MEKNEKYMNALIRTVTNSCTCEVTEGMEPLTELPDEPKLEPFAEDKHNRIMAKVRRGLGLAEDLSTPLTQATEEIYASSPRHLELSNASIVIIDDVALTRQLLRVVLEEKGANVTTASNGRSGLDLIKCRMEDGISFDFVLVDYHLPDMPGSQVIRELRAAGYHEGIMLITAYDLPAKIDGANAMIQKSAGAIGIADQVEHILKTFAKQSGGTIEMKSCD